MQIRSLGINSATRFFSGFCSASRESLMKDGFNGRAMEEVNILTLRFSPMSALYNHDIRHYFTYGTAEMPNMFYSLRKLYTVKS